MNNTETRNTPPMTIADLPRGDTSAPLLQTPHFPTRFQAVLWRNWELISPERLARVLATDEAALLREAQALGLRTPPQVNAQWLSRGYLTIIRRNWHLLPYEQILQLLDWTPEQLLHVLHEEDFLWIKLGMFKPPCERVEYAPLSPPQQQETAALRAQLGADFPDINAEESEAPFSFVKMLETPEAISAREAAPSQNGEVTLDDSWTISYPRGSRVLAAFAKRFRDAHAARWNISLALQERGINDGETSGNTIFVQLLPDENLKAESHRLEVSPSRVLASGVDKNGAARALQFLEETMKARGGPHLQSGGVSRETRIDLRIIHPYNAIYGDVLADENLDPLPEGLLSRLSQRGVNGVWLQGLLYALYPWKHAPHLSAGYEKRLESLRHLCEKAGDYGIGVYLYMNEPRGLPTEWFDEFPALQNLRGVTSPDHGTSSLCTSLPEVRDYLRDGATFLFENVPQLAGLFTITMSENLTNCWSLPSLAPQCPRCGERAQAEVIAEVNALLLEGARRAKPDARVLAWTWGWSNSGDGSLTSTGWVRDAIEQMPEGVTIMCTSEEALPVTIGGIDSAIIDYTMSQVGPGPHAKHQWEIARGRGLPTAAKVQFNNTWENSAVPYIPVPDLVHEHLQNLDAAGVSALLLSWTLGGFPSPNLEMAAGLYWNETQGDENDAASTREAFSPAHLEKRRFGAAADAVRRAHEKFTAAFRQYPFYISGLYTAPQNYGPSNLLHETPTGLHGTMIGYPYDDLKTWRGVYPEDVYEAQWKKLSEGWREGLDALNEASAPPPGREYSHEESEALRDLQTVATATYLHFRSVYLQVAFIRRRDELNAANGAGSSQLLQFIDEILREEIELAQALEAIVRRDARIGFEASNHYYYTTQDLREKVLSCRCLRAHYAARVLARGHGEGE